MLFNVDKCEILYLGHRSEMVPYTMNMVGLQAMQESRFGYSNLKRINGLSSMQKWWEKQTEHWA
jgi:hypothetical protein